MKGGLSAEWKDEDFYQVFTNMANFFIEDNKEKPFFLFFSFHDIHVPRLPNDMFKGKSSMGVRGDAIAQMDWITGEVVNKLKLAGVLDDTIIIFTSDNGPVLNDGYDDGAVEMLGDHKPGGDYRGGKYSAYEAGTRVPTILHYPAKVTPGTSNALMSQVDIYASIASLVNIDLDKTEAIDSINHVNAWTNADVSGRKELIEESYTLSLRAGKWKYIAPNNQTNDWIKNSKNIEAGLSPQPQLFNVTDDPSESTNLASSMLKQVDTYQTRLNQLVQQTTRN
jgi:arylsulfatase A-like enzyme